MHQKTPKKAFFKKFIYGYGVNTEVQTISYTTESLIFIAGIILAFLSVFVFAGTNLPNNTSLMYPLQEVSKLECRMTPWGEEADTCKIALPRVKGANYKTYINNKLYTDIYTMRREGSYSKYMRNKDGSHQGIDIATAKGTPVYAIADGEVVDSRVQAGYGNVVKYKFIYNGKPYYTTNAHLSERLVKKGDKITKGQIIGKVGHSGVAGGGLGGYHLHFEIDNDINGRQVYAFWGCPERNMGKNDYGVVDKGLCRSYLEKRTQDPIVFLENAGATIKSKANTKKEPDQVKEPIKVVETNVDDNSDTNSSSNVVYKELQTVFMSDEVKDFLNKYKFEIVVPSSTSANKELTMTVGAKNKTNGEYYNNILPETLELISPDGGVKISNASIKLLNGKKDITFTSTSEGKKTIVFSFGGQQLAVASVEIGGSAPIVNNNSKEYHASANGKYACLYQTQEERMKYFR